MTLEQLANLGEALGGLAVLVSLGRRESVG